MSIAHTIAIETTQHRDTYHGWAAVIDALMPRTSGYEVDYLSAFRTEWQVRLDNEYGGDPAAAKRAGDDLPDRIAQIEATIHQHGDTLGLAQDGRLLTAGRRDVLVALAKASLECHDVRLTITTTFAHSYHEPTTRDAWTELPVPGGEPVVGRWVRRRS